MSEKLKNLSTITKIFYLFALILFIAWVIPSISSYYSNVSTYKKNIEELKNVSSKYGIETQAKKFSEDDFLKDTQLLFSQVVLKSLSEKRHELTISMKQEDLKKFRTFIETISLRYYVKLNDNLEFTVKDKIITVKMQLTSF